MFDAGPMIDIITRVLNASNVYLAFGAVAGLVWIGLFIFILVTAGGLFREAAKFGVKGALAELVGGTISTLFVYVIYVTVGGLLFLLIFTLKKTFGSGIALNTIENVIVDTRLQISDEASESFLREALKRVAQFATAPVSVVMWGIFQLVSLVYVFVRELMEVLFALVMVVAYCWGFIAIPTRANEQFDLTKGLVLLITGLIAWVFIERIVLSVLAFMFFISADWVVSNYTGSYASYTIWAFYSSMILIIVLIALIFMPFLAASLSSNQSMLGAVGGMAGSMSAGMALMTNRITSTLGGSSGQPGSRNPLSGMSPNLEGNRNRDSLMRGLNELNQSPLQTTKSAFSNLAGRFSRGAGGGGADAGSDTPSGGGGSPTEASSERDSISNPSSDSEKAAPDADATQSGEEAAANSRGEQGSSIDSSDSENSGGSSDGGSGNASGQSSSASADSGTPSATNDREISRPEPENNSPEDKDQ